MSTHHDAQSDEDGVADTGDDNPLGDALSRADRFSITLDDLEGAPHTENDPEYVAALQAYLARRRHARWRGGRPGEPLAAGQVEGSSVPEPPPTDSPIRPDAVIGPVETHDRPDAAGTWTVNPARGAVDAAPLDEDLAARPSATPVRRRAGSARPAERRLLDVLALTAASGAFVAPSAWLLGTTASCVAGGIIAFAATGHPLRSLPRRAVRRATTLLHPRSLVWAPVLAARTAIAAVVLPAGAAAAAWILDEGMTGVMAAARAGAWTDGFRVAVVVVCVMLVTSVGEGRQRRAATVRRWASGLGDGALSLVVAGGLAIAALVIVGVPHPTDSLSSRADGLGWLPSAARDRADRARDDMVTAELNVLAECLSTRSDTAWHTSYTVDNALGEPDVARLVVGGELQIDPPPDLATAILAAHNQLASWVETIEVSWADAELVRTDRASLSSRRPLIDAAELVPATPTGRQWLETATADRADVLRCSAGPVL
jgi:hypothetical protein